MSPSNTPQPSQSQTKTSLGSLSIIRPPLALTILTGFLLSISAIAWACFAKVPIKVTAIGVLLPVDTISYIKAMGSGNINYYISSGKNRNDMPLYQKEVVDFINQPDSFNEERLINLSRMIASESLVTSNAKPILSSEISIDKGVIYAAIDNPSAREDLLSSVISTQKGNSALRKKNIASLNQIKLSRSQLSGQADLLKSMVTLYKDGYVSNPNVLSQKQTVDSLKSSIDNSKATIADTDSQIISKIEDLRSRLSSYINSYLLVSKQTMYVYRQDNVQGQPVQQGDTILIYSNQSKSLPTLIPVFMDGQTADQVTVGDSILATPLGFDKSQYGGIKGKLVKLSMTSLSLDDVKNLTGLQSISDSVSQLTNAPVLTLAQLDTAKNQFPNQGIYKWSSRGNPPAPVRFNDGLTIDITTNMVRPIELLLPALRRFTGFSSSSPPPQSNSK